MRRTPDDERDAVVPKRPRSGDQRAIVRGSRAVADVRRPVGAVERGPIGDDKTIAAAGFPDNQVGREAVHAALGDEGGSAPGVADNKVGQVVDRGSLGNDRAAIEIDHAVAPVRGNEHFRFHRAARDIEQCIGAGPADFQRAIGYDETATADTHRVVRGPGLRAEDHVRADEDFPAVGDDQAIAAARIPDHEIRSKGVRSDPRGEGGAAAGVTDREAGPVVDRGCGGIDRAAIEGNRAIGAVGGGECFHFDRAAGDIERTRARAADIDLAIGHDQAAAADAHRVVRGSGLCADDQIPAGKNFTPVCDDQAVAAGEHSHIKVPAVGPHRSRAGDEHGVIRGGIGVADEAIGIRGHAAIG